MNDIAAHLARADAFFFVVDRQSARDLKTRLLIRTVLHETQVGPFDSWLSASADMSIVAFGHLFHRQNNGDRILAGLPIAFCRDIEAFGTFLRAFDEDASSDPLERVRASALLVLIADIGKANAVRAIISKLRIGGANACS
jgi:hypothetical protein